MSLVIGTVLAFAFLEPPWRYLVLLPLAIWEGLEVMLWLRMRNRRSTTGVDGLLGATGRALSDCRPDGRVQVKGAVWTARCPTGASRGERIRVEGMEGLTLTIAPLDRSSIDVGLEASEGRRETPPPL